MREKLLEALFEDYYSNSPLTSEFEDAKNDLCENATQVNELRIAIRAEAEMAYKAAFNSALALMGGVQ